MRKAVILGATGSIGTTALRAIDEKKLDIEVAALVAFSSEAKLKTLSDKYHCPYFLNTSNERLDNFLDSIEADVALNGIAGASGLYASLSALRHGYDLALANKESVVMGGAFLFAEAARLGRKIIPVDSEHSAIYNLLKDGRNVSSLVITASGGPFLRRIDTSSVTVEEAANHPTWKMGRKISIDSATLANKGLEVIEAAYLFGFHAEEIEVVIHPQSVVHSMIRTKEGALYAQLSLPDMTLPILSALNDGFATLENIVAPLSFDNLSLSFEKWDEKQFPLLKAAYSALSAKGSYPIAFNAANEVAVFAFCNGEIKFNDIAKVVLKTLEADFAKSCSSYEEIMSADHKARSLAEEIINGKFN